MTLKAKFLTLLAILIGPFLLAFVLLKAVELAAEFFLFVGNVFR
jgi:hypothetical protein